MSDDLEPKHAAGMENQSIGTKTRFWSAIVRGITLILASCGFIAFLSGVLFEGNWVIGFLFWAGGTIVLGALTLRPDTLATIEDEGANKLRQRRMPWFLIALCVITGVGFNWVWIFLAFSRRYAFFSPQMVGATGLIMAPYAVVAFLVGRLNGGNWRMALLVFAVASCGLGAIVLRLIT